MRRFNLIFAALLFFGCSDPDPSGDAGLDGDMEDDAGEDAGGDADAGDGPCELDSDCDDGVFCNGIELCTPDDPSADERGCITGPIPCEDEELICDEESDRCRCALGDADGDGHDSPECGGDDCDDNDANRYPGNAEVCDAEDHDEDCDPTTFGVRDLDADGYVDINCCNVDESGGRHCGNDCEDTRAVSHPGNTEACDGFDNDCDGEIDEGVFHTYYADGDGDGYGSDDEDVETALACDRPEGFADTHDDCNDDNREVHPGALEICDSLDNNCDGETDPGCGCTSGQEQDCGTDVGICEPGIQTCNDEGFWGDCLGDVEEGTEVCNGLDDDCDGEVDEGVLTTYYEDADSDGYGNPSSSTTACSAPGGYVLDHTDCDDSNNSVHPGATEICDGLDTDCSDGGGARPAEDEDGDGHAIGDLSICSGGPFPNDDCHPTNGDVFPGQTSYFSEGFCQEGMTYCPGSGMGTGCCPGACVGSCMPFRWDYNCNEEIDREPPGTGTCLYDVILGRCVGGGPITGGSTPSCGSEVSYLTCFRMIGGGCRGLWSTRGYPCR